MIDRKELAEELILREQIRHAIAFVKRRREKDSQNPVLTEEKNLRAIIRDLIVEAKKIAVYDSTGKNELNVFLLNSSFLSTIETSYRKLTTSPEQRQSYIEHLVAFVNEFLLRLDSLEKDEFASDEDTVEEPEEVEDKIKVSVGEPESEDEIMAPIGPDDIKFNELVIPGLDRTGAKNAYTDFLNTKAILRQAYSNLDREEDKLDFKDELPKQIILYGRQYETSLVPELGGEQEASVSDVDASLGAGEPVEAPGMGEPETGVEEFPELETEPEDEDNVAAIELQEVIKHLNIDDIIDNLL